MQCRSVGTAPLTSVAVVGGEGRQHEKWRAGSGLVGENTGAKAAAKNNLCTKTRMTTQWKLETIPSPATVPYLLL